MEMAMDALSDASPVGCDQPLDILHLTLPLFHLSQEATSSVVSGVGKALGKVI
jgi:hypothetical protein